MLNNNLLAKSDFLTGAFPAEYANARGSVFDLHLRKGNDERHEFLGQLGFNGLELGTEGPFSKKSKTSYFVNYRYSIFSLLKAVGYGIAGTPSYQDFTAKVDVPVGARGTFSAWTRAGRSHITFLGQDVDSTKPTCTATRPPTPSALSSTTATPRPSSSSSSSPTCTATCC